MMTLVPGKRLINCIFVVFLLFFSFCLLSCTEKSGKVLPEYSFPFLFENNRIVLTATVNGVEGTYMFDTGAEGIFTCTSVDNLESIESPYEKIYLLGTIQSYDTYALDTIKIGETEFPVSTMVQHSKTKILGFDGIIGGTIFKGYFVELSFSDKVISLYTEKPDGYSQSIPLFFSEQFYPVLGCNADGVNIPFIVDTGNPQNICFPLPSSNLISADKYEKILSRNPDYQSYRVHLAYFDDGFRIHQIITGNANPLGSVPDGLIYSQAGNIGLDYLKRFDIVMDYRGSMKARLYYRTRNLVKRLVRPRKGTWYICGKRNAQYNTYGLDGWNIENENLYISSVIENGKAHKAGILPGTQVLRINGKDFNKFSDKKKTYMLLIDKNALTLDCIIDGKEEAITFTSE